MAEVGYPDYQRVVNWDSPPADQFIAGAVATTTEFAVKESARYATLAGTIGTTVKAVSMLLQWWNTKTKERKVGSRLLILSAEVTEPMQFRFVHLGPWYTIKLARLGIAGSAIVNMTTFQSNRIYPLEIVPQINPVVNFTHAFAGAGTFSEENITYCSGPARLFVNVEGATLVEWQLEVMNTGEFWTPLDHGSVAAKSIGVFSVLVPYGAYRIKLKTTAATEAQVVLSSTPTGSL